MDAPMQPRHTLVLASAGSGKTFQLTNAFIARLLEGSPPHALLATTFTRVAAGEILHRVLGRLSAAVLDDRELDALRAHTHETLTRERCAETLASVVGSMHRLSILTIDAFFARLAAVNAFELGLPPGWRTVEESEEASLRGRAVARALRETDRAATIELLRDLQGDSVMSLAHDAILGVVENGYAAFLATGDDGTPWSSIAPRDLPLQRDELDDAIEHLRGVDVPRKKDGGERVQYRDSVDQAVEIASAGDWKRFLGKGVAEAIAADKTSFARAEIPKDLVAAFKPLVRHACAELTAAHIRRTRAVRELLERFDRAYTAEKRSANALTFRDPPELLRRAGILGELEALYFRLDGSISHLLLDEFQDTALGQFELLRPLLDELLSQSGAERSVFCVGDTKQSLYQWREAAPDLLPAMGRNWPVFEARSLTASYRSSPAVIDTVNALFSNASANDAMTNKEAEREAAAHWDEQFETHRSARTDLSGVASLRVAEEPDGEPSDKDGVSEVVIAAAAGRVREILASAPNASVAIIVRKAKHIRGALAALRRLGIDASERRGNPLVDAPVVAAAASLLRSIDHPGHSAGLFHAARTPLGEALGLRGTREARDAAVARMRRFAAERGVAPLLQRWYRMIAGRTDARGGARYEQLIAAAEKLDRRVGTTPAAVADFAESERVDEPGASPVRVMTIHGSKGLEFDAVVLPLFDDAWSLQSRGVLTMREEPLGPVTAVSRYPDKVLQNLHPDLARIHEVNLRQKLNEELCCLYVAATRARRSLDMVVPADKNGRRGRATDFSTRAASGAAFARSALAPNEPAAPGTLLYRHASGGDWTRDPALASDDPTPTPREPVRIRFERPGVRPTTRLPAASPSRRAAAPTANAGALFDPLLGDARSRGTIMHAFFERVRWLDEASPSDEELLAVAHGLGFDEAAARPLITRFREALESEAAQRHLTRQGWLDGRADADTVEVERERAFALRDDRSERPALVRGRLDRLVTAFRGGRAIAAQVLDYKTDLAAAKLDAEELAAHAESHAEQMAAYRRAAAAITGIQEEAIVTTVFFTARAAAVDLTPIVAAESRPSRGSGRSEPS